jgi:hypothetical protein
MPGGPPITLQYSGSGATGGGMAAGSYSETWQLIGTPTITIPAGTFRTCHFETVSSLSPQNTDTKYQF